MSLLGEASADQPRKALTAEWRAIRHHGLWHLSGHVGVIDLGEALVCRPIMRVEIDVYVIALGEPAERSLTAVHQHATSAISTWARRWCAGQLCASRMTRYVIALGEPVERRLTAVRQHGHVGVIDLGEALVCRPVMRAGRDSVHHIALGEPVERRFASRAFAASGHDGQLVEGCCTGQASKAFTTRPCTSVSR